jgi:predicted RNA-binding protein with PIN domain
VPSADESGPPDPARFELVIVDGNNALGSRPDGWWRDRPRAMLRLLGGLEQLASSLEATRVEVVFDGNPHARVVEAGLDSEVAVSFAGGGADAADKRIAARVRETERPDSVLVVSSDRRLRAAVKAAGGSSTGAGGFVRGLPPGDG